MGDQPDQLAQRLADLRSRFEHPPGVRLGILRLPVLDSVLEDLEALTAGEPTRAGIAPLSPAAIDEIERFIDILSSEVLGDAPETVGRRLRFVEILRRATGGRLPGRAFDQGDAFGEELRAMLATDPALADDLGALHPLLIRATAVAPSTRWTADARALAAGRYPEALVAAVQRTLASLVRADIVSRPDLLLGGLRFSNQRLARGLLWFAAAVVDAPAELLGIVGLRMGTSGRRDAVVRDTALANTCAALLGSSTDPGAAAALASMRVKIVNRNVLKQVDRALAEVAARAGLPVATIIEDALPNFGLDEHGHLELEVGDAARLVVTLTDAGSIEQRWHLADGRQLPAPPPELASSAPGEVASIAERVEAIEGAVAEERRRMEARLASERTWPEDVWRRRFVAHPIGGHFGRRLVWVVGPEAGRDGTSALPDGDEGWLGADGRRLPASSGGRTVRLWHPADAEAAEIAAWRAGMAAAGIAQPLRQVDRETFRPAEPDRHLVADRRVGGRIVDHGQLRALLRERGWAVPALGSWDQGDEATAWRTFDEELRAELRYQAVERLPTGTRHERARLIAVRFVRMATEDGAPAPGAAAAVDAVRSSIELAAVPARIYSEALRDVSLVVTVGEVPPGPDA